MALLHQPWKILRVSSRFFYQSSPIFKDENQENTFKLQENSAEYNGDGEKIKANNCDSKEIPINVESARAKIFADSTERVIGVKLES
ncbi:uncharacterized protein LOC124812471 isoform X3 [Hydra vulgaris]